MQVNNKATGVVLSEAKPKSQLQGTSDEFLQLFIAQLKNQDPTDPMDSTDMVTNIAQLNQISYLEDMKDALQTLVSRGDGPSMREYGSLVDMSITYAAVRLPGEGAEGSIPGYHAGMSLELVDANGNVMQGVDVDDKGNFNIDPGDASDSLYFQVKDGDKVMGNIVTLKGVVKEVNILTGELVLDNGSAILYDNIQRIGANKNE